MNSQRFDQLLFYYWLDLKLIINYTRQIPISAAERLAIIKYKTLQILENRRFSANGSYSTSAGIANQYAGAGEVWIGLKRFGGNLSAIVLIPENYCSSLLANRVRSENEWGLTSECALQKLHWTFEWRARQQRVVQASREQATREQTFEFKSLMFKTIPHQNVTIHKSKIIMYNFSTIMCRDVNSMRVNR